MRPGANGGSDGERELLVASYNIHGGVGTDRRFDLGRIAAVIEEIDPDVVALQEVGDIRGRSPAGDHASGLGERLGRTALYQPTMQKRARAYGNAILTRLPVEGSRSYDLSFRSREPRGCLRADLRVAGHALHVFAVHLGLTRQEQRAQASMLLGADILRAAAVAWPLVVLGDFNFWFPGPIARTIRRALVDAAVEVGSPDPTYPTRMPVFRLDRVYVDAAWDVRWTRVHVSPLARVASDHYPLVAALRLRPSAIALPPGATGGTLYPPAGERVAGEAFPLPPPRPGPEPWPASAPAAGPGVSPLGPLPGAGPGP
jgi:endonuclease/exonuclease/phosphatase family metal-dependent hydrolase